MEHHLREIYLHPLPPLLPLPPPSGLHNLFRDPIPVPSLNLSAVPQQQIEQDQFSSYRGLYEQKCDQQLALKSKIKNHEEIIKILQQKNASLQQQVARLQEQKWKKFDYSRLSARGRSKSQKRVVPTIDVKVPHRMNQQHKQILIEQDKYIKTDRDRYKEDVSYYMQEVRQYKQENKKLKSEIKQLKMILKEQRGAKKQVQTGVYRSKTARSPQKEGWKHYNISTPIVTPFSPYPKESTQTVKKEMSGYDDTTNQLKRLKSQILYKELLLQKLRTEFQKQRDYLKRHLILSVNESQKIAEQTTSILNSFKAQIIRLSQQLLQYKRLPLAAQSSQRFHYDDKVDIQKDLVAMLKTRRNKQIAH